MDIITKLINCSDYILPNQSPKHYASIVRRLKEALSTSVVSSYDDTTEFCLNLTILNNRFFNLFVRPTADERFNNTVKNILVLLTNAWTPAFDKLNYRVCELEIFESLYDKAILRGIRQNEVNLFWRKLYYLYNIPTDDYPELEEKYIRNFQHLPERQLERLYHLLTFIIEVKLKYDISIVPNYVISRFYQIKQIMIKLYMTDEGSIDYYPYKVSIGNSEIGNYDIEYDLFKFVRRSTEVLQDTTPVFLGDYKIKEKLSSPRKPKKEVKIIVKRSRLTKGNVDEKII